MLILNLFIGSIIKTLNLLLGRVPNLRVNNTSRAVFRYVRNAGRSQKN